MKKISFILTLTLTLALLLLTVPVMSAETSIAQHAAIHWKTNNAPGIVVVDGKIREWPESLGARPTDDQIAVWAAEYQAYKKFQEKDDATRTSAKNQAMIDNLPSRAAVKAAIDNINNLSEAKAFLQKLADVVYWLARDKAD